MTVKTSNHRTCYSAQLRFSFTEGKMKGHQLIESASYGPDELKALGMAFDDAWLQIAPHVSNHPGAPEAARLKLAKIVLALAKDGIMDPQHLTNAAVDAMFDGPARLQP